MACGAGFTVDSLHPIGFLLAERCVKGLLVYGARRSWIMRSSCAVDNYENLSMLHKMAVARERMGEVSEFLKGALET